MESPLKCTFFVKFVHISLVLFGISESIQHHLTNLHAHVAQNILLNGGCKFIKMPKAMPEEENRIQIIEFYSGTHAIKIISHMLVTLL